MADDVIELVTALFNDLSARSVGVMWTATAGHLPLEVEVTPADCPARSFALRATDAADAVIEFAQQVQQWLIPQLAAPVPSCPTDGSALNPRLVGRSPQWVCPQGDFECEFGGYLLALWPPAPYDSEAAPMLAARLDAHGIRYTSVGLGMRGSTPIVQVRLLPGDDAAAVRAALAPFGVEVSWSDTVWIESGSPSHHHHHHTA